MDEKPPDGTRESDKAVAKKRRAPAKPFAKGNTLGRKFEKGKSPNPGGLTKAERILGEAYKAVLEGRWTPERLAAGLDAGAEAAASGDIAALRLMLDRTVGPIPEAPKVEVNVGVNVTAPIAAFAPAQNEDIEAEVARLDAGRTRREP